MAEVLQYDIIIRRRGVEEVALAGCMMCYYLREQTATEAEDNGKAERDR